jgi:RNA polymerase sigma factor (sigma-70 family)
MSETTLFLQSCLGHLKLGDLRARDDLVARVSCRLTVLAERMLRKYPGVARWEQAEDIFQQAAMRLHRSLEDVVPETVEDFYRLGALQLRRELSDMARRYSGPFGLGANHASDALKITKADINSEPSDPVEIGSTAEDLAIWAEFHACVECLPEFEKKVFELLWYHELKQAEAAELLQISERQLRRHWQSARLLLRKHLGSLGKKW